MNVLEELSRYSVLLLGLGREGLSSLAFLRARYPRKTLGVADKRGWDELDERTRRAIDAAAPVRLHLGAGYLDEVGPYDAVVRSAGVSPFLSEVAVALAGRIVTSNADLFLENCPGTVVGVTGTKGKSTTTSAIYETLRRGGLDARLTGNIGIPPLSSLEGATVRTVFAMELSSHQLLDARRSPQVAVVQNVVPEHLDYYPGFAEYLRAKKNIVRHQTADDRVVFNDSYELPRAIAEESRGTKLPFRLDGDAEGSCFVEDGFLVSRFEGRCERVMRTDEVPLMGTAYLHNIMPAIVIGRLFGVPVATIAAAIGGFRGLDHRLQLVASWNGVSFYNDSLATVPEAAIAALQAFPTGSVVLLAGGYERGQDYGELAAAVLERRVKGLLLFPTTGQRLWDEVQKRTVNASELPRHRFVVTMDEAVRAAYEWSDEGDTVLLSPAAASFGGFVDYADRGNRFKAAAEALAVAATVS